MEKKKYISPRVVMVRSIVCRLLAGSGGLKANPENQPPLDYNDNEGDAETGLAKRDNSFWDE